MGRKSQLPQSRKIKKQDVGPAAFFKHRKQAQQQQQQQQQRVPEQARPKAATSASFSPNRSPSLTGQGTAINASTTNAPVRDLLSSMVSTATRLDDESEENDPSTSSNSLPFSPYSHLDHSSAHGTNKDSSLRAYAHHLRSLVSQSDVLIQVLDARDPMGSRSSHTENLLAAHPEKKLLLILTKIDLVPKDVLQKWLLYLRQFYPALAFKSTSTLSSSGRASRKIQTTASASSSSLEASSSATLLQLLKNYARSQPKGMSLTVGIYGPPNVGKSSLINSLVKSRACSVAPRPGETKNLQTVLLDRKVRLIDSPGVAMSSARGLEDGVEDVLRGTVKIELVEDPAKPVGEILKRADPVKVTKLYKLPPLFGKEDSSERSVSHGAAAPSHPLTEDVDRAITSTLPATVDFASMRQETTVEHEDEGDASDEDDDGDDFHRLHSDDDDDSQVTGSAPVDGASLSVSALVAGQKRPPCVVGYDPTDVTDFLLRLAFTKGKMLRGGKPDIDGSARMVINDWNLGRIAWHKPPPESKVISKGSNVPAVAAGSVVAKEAMGEKDEVMTPAASVGTLQHNKVVNTFSDAFDLEGLFAQADAQLFGGKAPSVKHDKDRATLATQQPVANADKLLSAADVTSSSLGKRTREDEVENDDQSDQGGYISSNEEEEEEDQSDTERDGSKRLSGFASSFDKLDVERDDRDELMSSTTNNFAHAADGQGRGGRRVDGASDVPSALSGAGLGKMKPKIPAHVLLQQRQQGGNATVVSPSVAQGTTNAPRGQRSSSSLKKVKPAHRTAPPAYLERLEHKASLPTNVKKIRREESGDMELSGGGGKKGGERKRLRKMQKRENARGAGGVWKELEEVTLD